MNVVEAPEVVDHNDDNCSCYSYDDSVYHSFYSEYLGRPQPIDVASPAAAPTLLSSSIPEPDLVAIKDQRSYERAMQRLKKPKDRKKTKKYTCTCCHRVKETPPTLTGEIRRDLDEFKQLDASTLEDSVHSVKDLSFGKAIENRLVFVSLADLVKPAKKGAGMSFLDFILFQPSFPISSLSDKRFEFVGRPRQVLALDDFTEIDPNQYDVDDWEHIDADVGRRKPPRLSYAKVVARKA